MGIFIPDSLRAICQTEAVYVSLPGYKDYCVLVDGSCKTPTSVTNLFYGAGHNYTCDRLNVSDVSLTAQTVYEPIHSLDPPTLLSLGIITGV